MMEHPLNDRQAKETILVVDDEEDIRDLLSLFLTDLGFTALTAENGEHALKLFDEYSPAIVLTDIKMPGMDGIELLKKIKKRSSDTEVIMISGHGDMTLAIESLKHQASDFITKPIDDDILEIALNKVVERLSLKRQVKEHTENLEKLVENKSARVVELERQMAAKQIVEGLSSAMSIIADDVPDPGYFNEIPCFVSIHNKNMEVVTANGLFQERFGDLTGQKSSSIYKDYPSEEYSCPAAEAVGLKKGQRKELFLTSRDGRTIPAVVFTSPISNREKEIEMVLEIAVDISEVKRLQFELKQSQKKYQYLFDQVPCYITVQDRNLKILEANRLFRQDFDFSEGVLCHQAYKHREDPCPDCPILKTFEDGKHHQEETLVTAKNGDQYNILVWTAPMYDDKGEITRVMEVATNITQIRQLQDHITSLGIMLGSMSHGVKGLLMALDGGIYRVDSGIKKNNMDKIKAGWTVVKNRMEHIKKMVLDTLYYAKSRDLELSSVTLKDFAQRLADTVKDKATQGNVSLDINFNKASGNVQVDESALFSALINFLENAVDACLYDRSKEDHAVRFTVSRTSGQVLFEISDNGTGMDRETREKMFSLFFSSKGANGTGIGLFISNQIIKEHNGDITVDSTPGRGTTFQVQIPVEQTDNVRECEGHDG